MRLYELARELDMKVKDLQVEVNKMNIPVYSHVSSLSAEDVDIIKENLNKNLENAYIKKREPIVIRKRRISRIDKTNDNLEGETVANNKSCVEDSDLNFKLDRKLNQQFPHHHLAEILETGNLKNQPEQSVIYSPTENRDFENQEETKSILISSSFPIQQVEQEFARGKTSIEKVFEAIHSLILEKKSLHEDIDYLSNQKVRCQNEVDLLGHKLNNLRHEKKQIEQEIKKKQEELDKIQVENSVSTDLPDFLKGI